MADQNKVRYGLSNFHYGTYTEGEGGAVTLGSCIAIPGAVSINMDPDTAEAIFWADNIKYNVSNRNNGYTGDLVMAKYPDAFKTACLNYIAVAGGGIAESKLMETKPIYIAFEVEGNVKKTRYIVYNVKPGHITENHQTTEEDIEVSTESLDLQMIGDNKTGIVKTKYEEGDTGYDTVFTNPPAPALPASA